MYVYYGAAPVMSVYDSAFGLPRSAYAVGGCHRGNSRRYLQELDTFRGTPRLWVIVTHSLAAYREREDIVTYLDSIGTRLDYLRVESRAIGRTPPPAEGFLYDLSQPPRLASADAGSFTLIGRVGEDPRLTCGKGPLAIIASDFEWTESPDSRCARRPITGS